MLLVTFGEMISNPLTIAAILFASFGIAISMMATKITKLYRKTEEVSKDDKLLLGLKIAGLILILLAFVMLLIWGSQAL